MSIVARSASVVALEMDDAQDEKKKKKTQRLTLILWASFFAAVIAAPATAVAISFEF